MKITVGMAVSIITIVGTLLIAGANFGDLRSATKSNSEKIMEYRYELEQRTVAIREDNDRRAIELRKESMENMRIVAKMSADIEWIKGTMRRQYEGQ